MNKLLETTNNTHKENTLQASVISNCRLSDDVYQLTLECEEIAKKALPGEFVSVLCKNLLLRRPFSISNTEDSCFQIIYKLKGQGTVFLSELTAGDRIDLIGPLGSGFNITKHTSLLIGAGVGLAPLLFLSKNLTELTVPYFLLAGLKTTLDAPAINLSANCLVTEDGSSGQKGTINEYIESAINSFKPQKIYACGPIPVLKFAVEQAIKNHIEIEVALEKKFACGIGVCMGCVVEVMENNNIINKRICKDGPVFDGRKILW